MAISMLDNISYRGKKADNERSLFSTIADMVAYSENYLPDIYITTVVETGKQYKYERSNTVDENLGKWREMTGGGDMSAYYTKVEVNGIVDAVKDIADENATNIGSVASLVVDTWPDLVTAINALYNGFMQSLVYTDKKMVITYRNGSTVDIDVSAVITDTNIEEFKNVYTDSVEDGQALVYDTTLGKYTNKTIDLVKVLQDAKNYTDEEIVKAQESNAVACDEKPLYDAGTDTVTYKIGGETKTEEDTVSWFYYKDEDGNAIQTRWINGIEFTIDMGSINLDDYVNKTTDVTGSFDENPSDLTKIPNLEYMQSLRLVLVTALGKKVNKADIVDNLLSESTDTPLSANQGKVLDGKITDLSITVDGKVDIQQDVENAGKFLALDELGKIKFVDGGSAENMSYENTNYPTWTTVKKAIDGIISKVDYVKPSITSFTMTPSTTVYEVGQSVDSITFNWTTNKDIVTQSLTDCTLADENIRTATFDTPITSAKTFTLSIGDGQNTDSRALSIAFRSKAYWGSAAKSDSYNSAFVLGLSKNAFATAVKGTYDMTVGDGEYGFLCVPSSFTKISSWYIGGFEIDLVDEGTMSLTNESGGVVTYRIYRTTQPKLGTIKIEVK